MFNEQVARNLTNGDKGGIFCMVRVLGTIVTLAVPDFSFSPLMRRKQASKCPNPQ